MNGCGGCYCGNCSERANSCNVTTGGAPDSRIALCSHHHYHTGKLRVLPSRHIKFKAVGICYSVSLPLGAWVVLQGVRTLKGIPATASVIYSEQEKENKVLPGFGCFDRCQQIEKKTCLVGLIVFNQMKEIQTKCLITAATLDQCADRALPR